MPSQDGVKGYRFTPLPKTPLEMDKIYETTGYQQQRTMTLRKGKQAR